VGSLDGSVTFRKKERGSKKNPVELGEKVAKDLLKAGAKNILNEIYRSVKKV
jgi:porphobilinogen deaminase